MYNRRKQNCSIRSLTEINLISMWARRFYSGLLNFLFPGPTWPLENFTKLHPCRHDTVDDERRKPIDFGLRGLCCVPLLSHALCPCHAMKINPCSSL